MITLVVVVVALGVLLALFVALFQVRVRVIRGAAGPDPYETLRAQLAAGEIDEQAFWERESALRASERRRR